MDELKQIGEMIYSNVQWIFSGIGVAVISILGGKAAVKKVKRKQKAKNQGVNISSDKDINSENILTQTAGENSKNLNVMGDYHEGLSYKDARQVALDVFKANSSVYTEIAKKTIDERVVNITDDIFTMIYSELPDTVEKLVEPAVQDTLLKIQKEYAKNDDPALKEELGEDYWSQLMDEIELLDGASAEFDQDMVSKGELSPVFFGSALTNFGVETFLQHFLKMTYSPLPRNSDIGPIDPFSEDFSAFVFKIQANMNKAHRARIAFMRICSGKFEAGMEVNHVQGGKKIRLTQPQQLMAESRKIIDEAYAGDIIGVFDRGIFSIGDTITMPGSKFEYEGIPTFAPEHFCRVVQLNSMKRKQFVKGITQIAQEGAIQIFQEFTAGMSEIIVGVVGVLQFDVLKYRLENEYGCEIRLESLPYEYIRWVGDPTTDVTKLKRMNNVKAVKDMKGNPLLLFVNDWMIRMVLEDNEGLELLEFKKN